MGRRRTAEPLPPNDFMRIPVSDDSIQNRRLYPRIEAALPAINWRHVIVELPASTIRFTQPGVRIDLGGIAKGYAVDTSIALLKARGITNATVTAGGSSDSYVARQNA